MSFFAENKRTLEIEVSPGNTVTVRKLSYGEKQLATAAGFRVNPFNQSTYIDINRTQDDLVIASVVAWAGDGFEGQPVNARNILALPPEIIDRIKMGIDSLYQAMGDDEKKLLIGSTSAPSSTA